MPHQFTLTLFTPAEAERVTGLSVGMQRDWRNRGFLPKNEGHARFDAFALARMMAMKMMSDRGVGPQKSREEAEWCALGIVAGALREISAYEGDHDKAMSWSVRPSSLPRRIGHDFLYFPKRLRESAANPAPDLNATRREIAANFINAISQENIGDQESDLESTEWSWGEKADWLRKTILRGNGYRFEPGRYFVSWADGSHIFHISLDQAFRELTSVDTKADGPVIVLDLHHLGGLLLDRAERPIVHVELEASENSEDAVPSAQRDGGK